ncbi:MAG: tyrosine-protein phosphatase, partial [Gammaproteobacteria bacterium]
MNQSTRRWLELEGAQNCRDLGGIPVSEGRTKYNRIYRGDALHELSNSDQARLEALQLSAIIDFRSDFERRAAPNKLSDVLLSKVRAESFIPQKTHALFDKVNNGELSGPEARQSMCEQYRILTLEHTDIYGRVIDNIIALNDASVLFHCTSGKDRTGIMAAILLAAVGASEDEIVADYLLTNGRIKPV